MLYNNNSNNKISNNNNNNNNNNSNKDNNNNKIIMINDNNNNNNNNNNTRQNLHLIQNDVKFQWNVFVSFLTEDPHICLNKVPIVSIQHFTLPIPDYRHISFQ